MASDMDNSTGLSSTVLGQKASQTRIRTMNPLEWGKLREELKALNPNANKVEEDITLIQDMLDRVYKKKQPTA